MTLPEPTTRAGGPSQRLTALLVAVMCLIWGTSWVVIKGGLRDLPPFTGAGARFVVAAVAMIAVAAVLHRREGGSSPPVWLWMIQGVANFAIPYGVVYRTETVLPSGLVALLWGVYPMVQALAGHWFLPGERLRRAQLAGFAVALVGLFLLFRTDIRGFGPEGVPAALLLLTSPVAAVVGTTLIKRYGGHVSSTLLNRNAMGLAAVLMLAGAVAWERDQPMAWTALAISSVVYLALAGTVLTFSLFFWLLRWTPAHKLALIAYVTPSIALFVGWAVGREPVTAFTLGGAALILSGVILVVHRQSHH